MSENLEFQRYGRNKSTLVNSTYISSGEYRNKFDKITNNKDVNRALYCQTAHCGRRKPHFDFGGNTSPIVPYRHLPQTLCGLTADCRSLV